MPAVPLMVALAAITNLAFNLGLTRLRHPRCGDGIERGPGHGGGWFVVSEPVENGGDDGNRAVDHCGVARVVVVADRQSDVIERGHRVSVCGFESGKSLRQG